MSQIVLLQGTSELRDRLPLHRGFELVPVGDMEGTLRRLESTPRDIDAVVLTLGVGDTLSSISRIKSRAPELGVVALADRERCAETRRALRFAPFATGGVECVPTDDTVAIGAALEAATRRTRQVRALRATTTALNERLARSVPAPRASEYLGRLLDVAPVGILEADAEGTIVGANPKALELLELSAPHEGSLAALLRSEDADLAAWLATDERHGPAVFERMRAGASVRHLEVTTAPTVGLSGARAHIVIVQDVTARVTLERELRRSERAKDEFITMLAHELRNPLAPILTAAELIQRSGSTPPPVHKAREIIERQVRHLTRMVDDLLDVSRIQRGLVSVRLEPLDLGRLVREVVHDHGATFERAGLELRVTVPREPVSVLGDVTRLTQVLGNLLGNALKFTRRGGAVSVECRLERDRAGVLVRDTGIGMSAEDLGRVFQPFAQADRSLDRGRGGLGLGLAVARGLIELHRGRVAATSEGPGRGSELAFWLPLSTAEVSVAPSPVPEGAQMVRRRVLIVEDNHDAADVLRDLIETLGHDVHVARDGRAGVDAAKTLNPDIVLCDIGLPGMDGYAVAREIRAAELERRPWMVALTGYGRDEDRRSAFDAGFDAHLVKPLRIETLEDLLRESGVLRPADRGE